MSNMIQSQQAAVGQQRDLLELERKSLAAERRRDQILTVALENLGLLLACLMPLLLAAYALFVTTRSTADEGVSEFLVQEITSIHPLLLSAPAPQALPGPIPSATPPQQLAP